MARTKILLGALWLNICAIAGIMLSEMEINTVLVILSLLILLNTIAMIFVLGTIALVLVRMNGLMADVRISIKELTNIMEQQSRFLESAWFSNRART